MSHQFLTSNRVADVCPFIIMADRSGSMQGSGIEHLNTSIPQLVRDLREDWQAAELARVGMFAFNDQSEELFAISDPQDIPDKNPGLEATGRTGFGEAFAFARQMIARDLPNLGDTSYRPVLFVLSDGRPTDPRKWRRERDILTSPSWPLHPNVVTFPFGDPDIDALKEMATREELCLDFRDMEKGAAVREILNLVLHSVVEVTQTVSGEAREGNLRSRVARMLFQDDFYQQIIYTHE